jgi:hypothetical protein
VPGLEVIKEPSDLAQSGNFLAMVLALLWRGSKRPQSRVFQGRMSQTRSVKVCHLGSSCATRESAWLRMVAQHPGEIGGLGYSIARGDHGGWPDRP